MADAAKGRKRNRKSVYIDDSDDDFSDPTPAQPKPSKLKKKSKDVVVYTSTQATQDALKAEGRKTRVSAEEIRFQKELEEAIRMSADDTVSSVEIITTEKKFHNPSSADTIDINDLTLTDDEQNKENVGTTNIISAALSEKEMQAVGNGDYLPVNEEGVSAMEQGTRTPVKKCEARNIKRDVWIVNPEKDVSKNKKALNTSTDDETITSKIVVEAQVHKTDEGKVDKESKNKGMESIVEADDEISPPRKTRAGDDSPPHKRQRKQKKLTIESDSEDGDDKDFGADDIQEVSEEEDDFSEDEYKPAAKKSKKKTPPAKKTKKSPAAKKSAEKKTPINAPAKKTKADAVPENDSESDNEDFYSSNTKTTNKKKTDTLSTGEKAATKSATESPKTNTRESGKSKGSLVITTPKVGTGESPVTPSLNKAKPTLGAGASFTKVKIPTWTPPAKIGGGSSSLTGSRLSSPAIGISPAAGMRLGLSRNARVLKPLHSTVKNN